MDILPNRHKKLSFFHFGLKLKVLKAYNVHTYTCSEK